MKYLLALILGVLTGVVVACGIIYYNPFTSQSSLSPLAVSERQQFTLNYSAVATDSIVYTNDGESRVHPHPVKVLQLWEAPIRLTNTMVTMLRDSRNEPVGLGVKFSSQSERTRLLSGEALVDSAWYIYLPGQGSMLIEQTENYWTYLREIVIPAHWSSGDSWRGNWHGMLTRGPGALGTAFVYGGSGAFEGFEAEAIETITARAYDTEIGPVAMDGQLTIEYPAADDLAADAV
ncbi:MAG: hypothetical protein R3358_13615, partial [Woeseiaceae bacterium]|nr:hypothetical protein [Woeseiaceae bacterium]